MATFLARSYHPAVCKKVNRFWEVHALWAIIEAWFGLKTQKIVRLF